MLTYECPDPHPALIECAQLEMQAKIYASILTLTPEQIRAALRPETEHQYEAI